GSVKQKGSMSACPIRDNHNMPSDLFRNGRLRYGQPSGLWNVLTSSRRQTQAINGSPFISIHLPKCAGTSLGEALKNHFKADLFLDYGDRVVDDRPVKDKLRSERRATLLQQLRNGQLTFKIIHGHFYAQKYVGVFSDPRWITIMRHPLTLLPS